jgi:hypothetical protein
MTVKTVDELLDLSEFDNRSLMTKYVHHGADIDNFSTTGSSPTDSFMRKLISCHNIRFANSRL